MKIEFFMIFTVFLGHLLFVLYVMKSILLIIAAILLVAFLYKICSRKKVEDDSNNETSFSISDNKYEELTCSRSSNSITWNEAQNDHRYLYCTCEVKGGLYLNEQEKNISKMLSVGDNLLLEKEPTNKFDMYAIKVLTESGGHIGYLPKEYADKLYLSIAKVKLCVVSKKTNHEVPFIFCQIYFDKTDELPFSCINVSTEIKSNQTYAVAQFPELKTADKLKRTNPQLAIELLKPIMELEKGIEAKRMCCIAYRELKAYDEELLILKNILLSIDNLQSSDVSDLEYRNIKASKPSWEKRTAYVERILRNRKKNKGGQRNKYLPNCDSSSE